MKIGGLQKLTLIDYPKKPACTIFLAGCNFRCPWCHSPSLVVPKEIEKAPAIDEGKFFEFLKSRQGLLEGVVICGGEPTIHEDLPELLEKIKKLGYSIKLDTNGSNPEMIKRLLKDDLLDYVAMDIKAPFNDYKRMTKREVNPQKLEKSVELIKDMKTYEFRTTVIPGLHTKKDLLKMANQIKGAKKYFYQKFRGKVAVDDDFKGDREFPEEMLEEVLKEVKDYFEVCKVR